MTARMRLAYGVVLVGLVPGLAVAVLTVSGGISPPATLGLPDPGSLTRWGLPLAGAARNVAATLTVGLLVVAAVVLPPERGARAGRLGGVQQRAVRAASLAGSVWVLAGLSVLVLTYSDVAGVPVSASGFPDQLGYFATEFDMGRSLIVSVLLSAVAAVGSAMGKRYSTVGVLALVSLAALWPLALTGHAAGALNHAVAVNMQFVHLVAVAVWVGGLAALALVRRDLGNRLGVAGSRYSTLAGCCFVLVAMSGVIGATLRLVSWSDLQSSYGALVLLKVVALTALGAAGWYQRRRILSTLTTSTEPGRRFAGLAAAELLVMGAAMALGVALGRTPPPATGAQESLTVAESLLGFPMPPPLGATEWVTQWRLDSLWTPLALLAISWYLFASVRLRRRGDKWSAGRTAAWLTGCLLLIWATSGPPAVYGSVLFSMHMVQHMTIATAVPPLLVLGAPVTLALRTLSAREDESRGAREWLLLLVHSLPLRLLGHPVVAAAMFIVSMVAFYYSPLFESSLRTHTGHVVMLFHFLFSGYLFASVICGVDPGPERPPYPLRALLLMITFGFHALFSVSLMGSTQVLAQDWFSVLPRTWGRDPLRDQQLGASIGWALGESPLVIMAFAMFWQWTQADRRERRRYDRKAARDGDSELAAYNAGLSRLTRGQTASDETVHSARNPSVRQTPPAPW